jgi:sulfur carrier protein
MFVIINGKRADVTARDLINLLSEMDYEHTHLAIAVNQQVIPRARWRETALSAGDQIEIITPRQGG